MTRFTIVLLSFLFQSLSYAGGGLERLEHFHDSVKSIEAEFSQVLRDTNNNKVQESSGKVWIKRPGQFRWEYDDPYPQIIVGDGQRIWIYDPELEQVTVKEESRAIGNAPALILSGQKPLSNDFKLSAMDREDQYQWVSLVPKQEDSDFAEISVAFQGEQLVLLELKDNLGQRTLIRFESQKLNDSIDKQKFRFTIPPGTDVIGADQF